MSRGPSTPSIISARLSKFVGLILILVITLVFYMNSDAQQTSSVDDEPIVTVDLATEEFQEETINLPHFSVAEDTLIIRDTNEVSFLRSSSARSYSFVILSIRAWPEFKAAMKIKCILRNPFNEKCISKTKIPVVYRRISTIEFVATVYVPSEEDLKGVLRDCITQAVAAGAISGLATNSPKIAADALGVYLNSCLVGRGKDVAGDVDVRVTIQKQPGKWRPF